MRGSGNSSVAPPRSPGRDEPCALLRSYRATGDRAARERLVELLMPLVRAVAWRYANRGERLEDLVQVGAIGLIEAIDRFDEARGDDLARFALPTITGEIRHHLRDRASVVRVPRGLQSAPRAPVPLSTVDDDGALGPVTAVDRAYESSDDRLLLASGFRTLGERERRILHLRFYLGLSQGEIAGHVGLSQVQVSRLIRSSLERMRSALTATAPGSSIEH